MKKKTSNQGNNISEENKGNDYDDDYDSSSDTCNESVNKSMNSNNNKTINHGSLPNLYLLK